ncbi:MULTISPECIES: CBS domain-containing protein [Halolamina]|uniref:CBS domain-containing protein n=1 Tax=Halolamina TaxID=1075397 RepID=UPI000944B6E9|nr:MULTISPECIES: CBS domain-containing protein [Halolamina]NHX37588.1 CBS domain-containing protein [Halolamina sp. R1-12]
MDDSSTCTAGAIATPNPYGRETDETVETVAAWLEERDFDTAPVYDDGGNPIGYVTDELLADCAPDQTLGEVSHSLGIDQIISRDTSFENLLSALYEQRFYYLADRNEVTGVVTRADLNTDPVYRHLYSKLSRLEHSFRDCITTHASDWLETAPIDPEVVDDIRDREAEAKKADVALDPVHYAQFSTLVTVITSKQACWQHYGFDADHKAGSELDDIVALRNDVAHSTPIIENTNRGLGETGRTITDLLATYRTIQNLLAV